MTTVMHTLCAQIPGTGIVCSYRGGSKIRKALDAIRGLLTLRRELLRHPEIGIVHIHSASNGSFRRKMHFARLAKRHGRKVLMHIHGGGFADFLATDPQGIVADLNSLDGVVCLSQQWADILSEAGVKRLFVLPNPVADPVRVEVEPDGRVHFLFLGLLDREKGVYDLLQAAADNRERWSGKLVIHIGGVGPEETNMRKIIADHRIGDLVRLEGWVEGAAKARLFSQSSALLLPSYVEAMPVSLLEAMSYELPVITTPVGSIPTMVTNGDNGLLVSPGSPAELASAIDQLAGDSSLRTRMGARGKKIVEKLSPEHIGEQLQTIYSKL